MSRLCISVIKYHHVVFIHPSAVVCAHTYSTHSFRYLHFVPSLVTLPHISCKPNTIPCLSEQHCLMTSRSTPVGCPRLPMLTPCFCSGDKWREESVKGCLSAYSLWLMSWVSSLLFLLVYICACTEFIKQMHIFYSMNYLQHGFFSTCYHMHRLFNQKEREIGFPLLWGIFVPV